jgi:transposase-like protein
MIDENGVNLVGYFCCSERYKLRCRGIYDLSITPSSRGKEALVLRINGYSYADLANKFGNGRSTIKKWVDKEINLLTASRLINSVEQEREDISFSYRDISYESQYEAQLTKLEYVKKLRDIVKSI